MSKKLKPSLPFCRWHRNVVEVVDALANRSAQEAAWREDSSPSTFNSPDELMCMFFDDVIVPDFLEECSASLRVESIQLGIELTKHLSNFQWPMSGGFIDAARLLSDTRWSEVRVAAGQFLDSLKRDAVGN